MKQPPINENNLLRFTSTTEPTTALETNLGYGLHSGNRKWRRSVLNPLPALKGETYTFYTNFPSPTFDPANLVLVYDNNCTYNIITDPLEPSITAVAWGSNNIKVTLTIPSTASINKFIRVGVATGDPLTVTHVSNLFMVLPLDEDHLNNTHLFKFYHNTNIYNFEWANYDPLTDTPYTIRIPSTKKGVEYPREVSTYESATSGRSRNTRATNKKDINFQIYFREDEDHDALASMINFKSLSINQKEYLPTESYEPEYNEEFNIYVASIKLRDVAYSVRINGCNT